MVERDFFAILETLHQHKIAFILVGGLAANLQGVAANTFDVDVVHARDGANIERLLAALQSMDAIFRIQPERRFRPDATHLSGRGHLNLLTRFGHLDVLCAIGGGRTYEDLLPHTEDMDLGGGVMARVLDLETQIAVKEEVGSAKDRAVLPLLRATLEEKKRLRR